MPATTLDSVAAACHSPGVTAAVNFLNELQVIELPMPDILQQPQMSGPTGGESRSPPRAAGSVSTAGDTRTLARASSSSKDARGPGSPVPLLRDVVGGNIGHARRLGRLSSSMEVGIVSPVLGSSEVRGLAASREFGAAAKRLGIGWPLRDSQSGQTAGGRRCDVSEKRAAGGASDRGSRAVVAKVSVGVQVDLPPPAPVGAASSSCAPPSTLSSVAAPSCTSSFASTSASCPPRLEEPAAHPPPNSSSAPVALGPAPAWLSSAPPSPTSAALAAHSTASPNDLAVPGAESAHSTTQHTPITTTNASDARGLAPTPALPAGPPADSGQAVLTPAQAAPAASPPPPLLAHSPSPPRRTHLAGPLLPFSLPLRRVPHRVTAPASSSLPSPTTPPPSERAASVTGSSPAAVSPVGDARLVHTRPCVTVLPPSAVRSKFASGHGGKRGGALSSLSPSPTPSSNPRHAKNHESIGTVGANHQPSIRLCDSHPAVTSPAMTGVVLAAKRRLALHTRPPSHTPTGGATPSGKNRAE